MFGFNHRKSLVNSYQGRNPNCLRLNTNKLIKIDTTTVGFFSRNKLTAHFVSEQGENIELNLETMHKYSLEKMIAMCKIALDRKGK